MKRMTALLLIAMLTACSPSETPTQPGAPTVEKLAPDPARLKELRQQCKTDRATLGDLLCNRVDNGVARVVAPQVLPSSAPDKALLMTVNTTVAAHVDHRKSL